MPSRYVDSYFRLSERQFRQRYFRDDPQSLIRAISSQSYKQIVEDLKNEAQVQIVTAAKESNQLVLAGPGSGKTRVVVHRAAYLLMVERIRPQHLLVICFNRSAMHELRVRLRALVGDLARGVAVHTYHSLALRITERSIADRVKTTSGDRIDFDKIIKEANSRLEGKEQIVGAAPDELRDRLLSGFEYVLVDEYQDIDADQYRDDHTHCSEEPARKRTMRTATRPPSWRWVTTTKTSTPGATQTCVTCGNSKKSSKPNATISSRTTDRPGRIINAANVAYSGTTRTV